MLVRRWAPRLHKWVALIVGLQLVAWTVSGLFMTAVPISVVRGEHNIRAQHPSDLRVARVVSIAEILQKAPKGVISRVELRTVAGRPAYEVALDDSAELYDALSGDRLSPLGEAHARRIAEADFAGVGHVAKAALVTTAPPIEFRGDLPVWQVSFDDKDATNIYVSPGTGRVVARRTATWRIYDFLWSLHIMDYSTRDNFNNPLVIAAAGIAFALTMSGGVLLFLRFWPRLRRSWRSPNDGVSQ